MEKCAPCCASIIFKNPGCAQRLADELLAKRQTLAANDESQRVVLRSTLLKVCAGVAVNTHSLACSCT